MIYYDLPAIFYDQKSKIIELGGGHTPSLKNIGAINCDVRSGENIDFVADFNEPLPIQSNEFDGVFSKFLIEHLSWRCVKQFIAEVYRILKPNGTAVFVSPNTEAQMKWVLNQEEWNEDSSCILYGSQDYPENSHKNSLSPNYAMKLFQDAGYVNIKIFPFGELRTDMIIECSKPEQIKEPVLSRKELFDKHYFNGGGKVGGYAHEGYWDYPCHHITFNKIMELKPESVLEVGCAKGFILKRIQDAGIPAEGMEISHHCYLTRAANGITEWDLCKTPWPYKDKQFDLCCHPDTIIHTKNGLIKISEIKIGDEVLTHTGEYHKVKKTMKRQYNGELIKIKPYCFSFPVLITPEHPVYAQKVEYKEQKWKRLRHLLKKPNWIESKELKKHDLVNFSFPKNIVDVEFLDMKEIEQPLIFNKYNEVLKLRENGKSYYKIKTKTGVAVKTSQQWVTKAKYPRGCWLVKNNMWFSSSVSENGFPIRTLVNEDFCRFVGYYLADGCTNVKSSHTCFVFGKNEDEYAQDVERIVKNLWGLDCRIKNTLNSITVEIDSVALSKLIVNFINKDNKKSLDKKIPHWMLLLPHYKQKQILIGLIRGDGCINKSGYTFCSSSLDMIGSVQLLCLRLNMVASIGVRSKNKITFIKDHFANSQTSYSLRIQGKSMLEVESSLENIKGIRKTENINRSFNFSWIEDYTASLPIKKVEKIPYNGYVYNLEVEKDNSYSTISFVVHNCTSTAVLEHIPEAFIDAIAKEMNRVSKRGLHGIDFGENDDGFDKTHCLLKSKNWWGSKLPPTQIVVDKEEMEQDGLPLYQHLPIGDNKLKLNIGCYTIMFHHGWVNIDVLPLQDFANKNGYKFCQMDMKSKLMFDDNSVDLIYSSHFLEHLDYADGEEFLKEAHRILKPHGTMRLILPDLRELMVKYFDKELWDLDEINDGSAGCDHDAGKFWKLLFEGHKSAYDFEAVFNVANKIGFTGIFHKSFRSGHPQILKETLDTLPCLSLYVELVK